MRRRHIRSTRPTRSSRHLHSLTPPPILALAVLAALSLILALVMVNRYQAATEPQTASAQSGNQSAELSVGRAGSGRPHEGYWIDSVNGTSYTAGLIPDSNGFSSFDFTVPATNDVTRAGTNVGEITGELPLTQLDDGTYAQGTPGSLPPSLFAATPSPVVTLPPSETYLGSQVQFCGAGTLVSDTSQNVVYTFFGHFSADGLAAYATFSYALVDTSGAGLLCSGKATQGPGITMYQLSAGCTATTCQDLLSQIGPSVATYDMAVMNGDWNTAYHAASEEITAQYSEAEFAILVGQQFDSTGMITAISAPPTTPAVQFTPENQAYFAAQQTITLDLNGSISTEPLTNYYLLQNGQWLFWFSS
ncbi:MAG: hypothetical protein ACLQUY_26830 [Ktedonobacterales bacterium]